MEGGRGRLRGRQGARERQQGREQLASARPDGWQVGAVPNSSVRCAQPAFPRSTSVPLILQLLPHYLLSLSSSTSTSTSDICLQTSLCVRRAVYWDPEAGAEDPAKKGICSNFLCDAKPGQEITMTGEG